MNINNITASKLRDYIERLTKRKDWLTVRINDNEHLTYDKAERNALIYAIYLMEIDLANKIEKPTLMEEE